jgi:hypothetical protein
VLATLRYIPNTSRWGSVASIILMGRYFELKIHT